ncbi:hypothetical protein E4T38_04182 [Aureobasidium subglaciale]|nr:hypothetical protein E4T38_04182 [Aureobasidium subglaciale]KAI5224603.1 hypothetical protein E4T40_04007 [Aureobasidium subglaciale]KAI5227854.1 hypothetical protein E4T41_04227 [Aureobasidium subglaciale]KAI5263328.1 hypothetical protein E4T46_03848 [Aureobasidium subglaciale]
MTLHTYYTSLPLCYFVAFFAAAFSRTGRYLMRASTSSTLHDLENDCALVQFALKNYSSVPGDASSLRGSLYELFNSKSTLPPCRLSLLYVNRMREWGLAGLGDRDTLSCNASMSTAEYLVLSMALLRSQSPVITRTLLSETQWVLLGTRNEHGRTPQ